MSPFLLYIARSSLYLSLFYAFYLLVMRRTTFFRLNRALLLSGAYLCLLLPFVRLRTMTMAGAAADLTMVAAETAPEGSATTVSFPWQEMLLLFYVAGALLTGVLYGISAWKMGRLIRKGKAEQRAGCRLVVLEEDIPSFSWSRTVVMGRKDLQENPAILTHERMHVQCRHSWDLLILLPIQLLFWWNPLVWITREELRLLHEYEADEGVLQKGIDATQYQLLLVRKAVGEQRFSLSSGFQHANLKNRISMMLKPTSSRWMRWSYLALIPVLGVLMYACNAPKNNQEAVPELPEQEVPVADTDNTVTLPEPLADVPPVPFAQIEVKPTFQGGDANTFSQWVNEHLKYPKQAIQDKVQGRITLRFTVGADGVLRDAKVLRGVREDLDTEALRVISASPKWEPGKQDGKAVPVTFVFPVIYQLK